MHTPPPMPLVGRTEELAALSAALDAASRGRGSVHFVVGEGGIGKTRIVSALADIAATRNFSRVVGRAYPVETGIPYALFADAFLPLLRSLPPTVLQVLARGSTAEIATLFPALRAEGFTATSIDATQRKPRLFDAFSRFVQRLAQREPLLVVLENLHWADPSSLELLHLIARGATAHRLVVVCSYDETRRDANATLRATEHSLRSLSSLRVHHVAPLTRSETHELIRRQFSVPGEAVVDFATRLHERTRGNPFFIEETIDTLAASGQLHEDAGQWTGWGVDSLTLPPTVRDAIQSRIDRLTPDAAHTATIAAAVGAEVPHALLEALAGLSADALLTAIDVLRHERIILEVQVDRELGYEFAHPLLREVLYTSLSRARARGLHAEIAAALEKHFGADALAHADTLAAHFLRAESPLDSPKARRYLLAAGRSALDRGADREAVEILDAALTHVDRADPDPAELESALDLLARARQRLGDYGRATQLWSRAVTIAESRNDKQRVAGHERRLGVAAFWSGRYDDAIAHYDRGLDAATAAHDEARTAMLRLARSAVLLDVGRADEAEADIRAALTIAERVGEPALLARVHHAMQLHAVWRGPAPAAREHGERALAFARQAGDRSAVWAAEWALAVQAGLVGDRAGIAEHLAAATAIADELRSPVLRLWSNEVAIEYHSGIGDWDTAIAIADRTIADSRAFSQHTLLPRALVWSSLVRFARGDFDVGTAQMLEAWATSGADRAASGAPVNVHAVAPAHVSRATWHLAQKQFKEALAVAEAGLAVTDRTGYTAWAIHRLVPIAGEAALWIQDWDRCERYATRLRDQATQLGHALGLAWADACFALIRMLKGDKKGAIAPLDAAASALEAIPFVDHATRVRRKLVDCYYETGDTESALRELRRIHDVFAKLGAAPALSEVREKMRALGARPPARTVTEGAGALTAREAEIARLVAARKTNKEIATALDISARTVGTHLSNVFAKLGVDSRGALTDMVRAGALESSAPSRID